MTRRTPALLSLIAAAACLVARPAEAPGSTILNFRLANEGTKPISQVDFNVIPPGAIVPPIVDDPETGMPRTGSPLTIMANSTGFDPTKFSVALGSGTGVQGLRLLFGQEKTVAPDGTVTYSPILGTDGEPLGLFMPGAVLNFALNVDSAAQNTLQLQLPAGASGLSLRAYVPNDPVTDPDPPGSGGPPPSQVPEPMPMVLWSLAAGLGLARVHAFRKSRRGA